MLYFLLTVGLLLQLVGGGEDKVLNEFINYYEPVVFTEQEEVSVSSPWFSIKKEDRGDSLAEQVEIRAFGRVFRLELRRTAKVLSSEADMYVLRGTDQCIRERLNAKSIMSNLVEGKVVNEPKSYVHGALRKGVFTGVIYLENQTLFVERASKYFREKMPFDCVIFRQEDLNMTAFDCGMGPDGYKCDPIRLLQRTGPSSQRVMPVLGDSDPSPEHSWFKRTPPKTTCTLKVVADHLFFQHAGENSAENAIYEMIFHIHEADRIFRGTDFNDDGLADNVGFKVEAVEVHTSTVCFENPSLAKSSVTSDQYLEIFSERDFHNFCVGVAFSGYTFPGRVLGIAWMADADNSGYVGGICEPRLYSTQDQKALSFNTAVITMMLEGRRMPRGITAIAVAHELGHSFGSDHDPYQDPICSPGRDGGGKFIMAAFAVKGDQPNNRFFSPCSKHNMQTVLKKKGTCFTAMKTASCVKTEDKKKCQGEQLASTVTTAETPRKLSCDKPPDDRSCPPHPATHQPDTNIQTNQPKPTDPKPPINIHLPKTCEISDTECIAPDSLCTNPGWCPTPHMPDGSSCSNDLGECWQGNCIINQCALLMQVSCECPTPENACIVCCKKDEKKTDETDCKPVEREDTPWWLLRHPGESCQQGSGECDQYGRCGLKPQDLVRINKSEEPEELERAVPPAASSEFELDEWVIEEDEEGEGHGYGYGYGYGGQVKMCWWKRIAVQLMWICLGTVMFFTLVLCICFICPAVAVGIWCLRQCACMSERGGDSGLMLMRERDVLPSDIFYQATENGHPIDLPTVTQCPIPDIQTRSRTI